MKKLISITIAIIALPVAMSANAATYTQQRMAPVTHTTPATTTSPFNGFYMGVGAGMSSLTTDLKNTYTVYLYPDELTDTDTLGNHNFAAKIFAGYGNISNNLYIGGELFAQYNPSELKLEDVKLNTTHGNYGALIRTGYLVAHNTIIYALLGIDITKFRYKFLTKEDDTKTGIMPGIGIETKLTRNVSARAQYTYVFYSDMKVTDKRSSYHDKYKFDNLHRSTFSIDLLYQFC